MDFVEKNTKFLKGIIIVINILFALFSLAMLIITVYILFEGSWQIHNNNFSIFAHMLFYLYVHIYFLIASIFQIIDMFKDGCELDHKIWFFDFFSFATDILVLLFYYPVLKWIFLGVTLLNFILKLIIVKINKTYYL